jgi:hypothetical protein
MPRHAVPNQASTAAATVLKSTWLSIRLVLV